MWYATYLNKQADKKHKICGLIESVNCESLFKQAETAAVLSPEQSDYVNSIYDDIAQMVRESLLYRVKNELIHPAFQLDQDTVSDIIQEAVIKTMEVVQYYWGEREGDYLWNTIRVSVRNILNRLTRSVQPVADDMLTRQYTPLREPLYDSDSKKVFTEIMDHLLVEEYGVQAYQQWDATKLAEMIDYIYSEYQPQLLAFIQKHPQEYSKLSMSPIDILRKEINRYKNTKVTERGGRHQVEVVDFEESPVTQLLDVIGFGGVDWEESAEKAYGREHLIHGITKILSDMPDDVKLATVLLFEMHPNDIGLILTPQHYAKVGELIGYDKKYDDLDTAWQQLVEYSMTKRGTRAAWSSIKKKKKNMFGSDSTVSKIAGVSQFQLFLRNLILEDVV